jgi:apolipoprotein N-acyltransferase
MDSKPDLLRRITIVVAAVLVSSAGFYFGTGLRPIWWITWIAPVPVLLAASRLSARTTFVVAFLALAFGQLNMWHYLRALLHIPLAVCLIVLLPPVLVFAFTVSLFRMLVRRGAIWLAVLSLPAAWVVWEYSLSLFSPHSTFGSLAYTQMNCLPLVQLASATGIWGISFCLLLLPTSIAVVLGARTTWRHTSALAVAVCLFLAAVFGFGYWRLHESLPPASLVRVGLIASDLPANIIVEGRDSVLRLLRDYSRQTETLVAKGAQVIVMPEKIAVLLDSDRDSVDALLQPLANRTGAIIVVGVVDVVGKSAWNEARIYFPGLTVPSTYDKHHMVPGFESNLTVGTARTEFVQPSGRWGVMICKDMDFPNLSRQYANDGTALLLVPAWDFSADGWLHGRMAILRGVEGGFSIVRTPKQGILTLTDDRGRVLSEQDTSSAPFVTILGNIPVRHDDTLYSRFGDWFAWLCVLLLILILISAARQTAGKIGSLAASR